MANFNLVSKQWCDLVFKNRNKAYGAYRLRAEAGKRYACAMGGVIVGCCFVLVFYIVWSRFSERIWERKVEATMEMLSNAELLKTEALVLHYVQPQPVTQKVTKAKVKVVPEIVDEPEEEAEELMPIIEESVEGVDTEALDTLDTAPSVMEEFNAEQQIERELLTEEEIVREMPTFPGGHHELMRWLDKNIIYPPLLSKEGIEGTTYLTFYVDTAGVVSDPLVEEPLHPMVTSAIMKAVEHMPKWERAQAMAFPRVKITVPIVYYKR